MLFDHQPGIDRHGLQIGDRSAGGRNIQPGIGPVTAEPAVTLNKAVLVIKKHKAISNAFDSVCQTLARGFSLFAGPVQGLVAVLELIHGLVERFRTFPHLLRQNHRVFKRRIGFGFVSRAGFHPNNKSVPYLSEAFILRLQLGNPLIPVVFGISLSCDCNRHRADQSPPP